VRDTKTVKVSREEFAEVLYHWLSLQLTKKQIEKTAKDLDFQIKSNEDFNRIFKELFTINMWTIVRSCERVFEDIDKRNECLDRFHRLVYERHTEGTQDNFGDWMISKAAKYVKYTEAMKTEHPSTPLWVVANLINRSLFGEIKKDVKFQSLIIAYIGLSAKHLGEAIKQYDIE
jgi:hypothetical protein